MVSELLDRAETRLNEISRSMAAADAVLLQKSQPLLQDLLEDLCLARSAASSGAHVWPQETRARFRSLQAGIQRLGSLNAAAASAVALMSRRPEMSAGGYTATGAATVRPQLVTISLDC